MTKLLFIGVLIATVLQVLVIAQDEGEGVTSTTMGMAEEETKGVAALEIKIEAEQLQDNNNELLQRIINLADEIMKEADDSVTELAQEGADQVTIDAEQARWYCEDQSNKIKQAAYKLWKDGKNMTLNMEDTAEEILDYEAKELLHTERNNGEMEAGMEEAAVTGEPATTGLAPPARRRRQANATTVAAPAKASSAAPTTMRRTTTGVPTPTTTAPTTTRTLSTTTVSPLELAKTAEEDRNTSQETPDMPVDPLEEWVSLENDSAMVEPVMEPMVSSEDDKPMNRSRRTPADATTAAPADSTAGAATTAGAGDATTGAAAADATTGAAGDATTGGAMGSTGMSIENTTTPIAFVDVELKASQIIDTAEHQRNEFNRELANIKEWAHNMVVVYRFQSDNIERSENGTAETEDDVKDTEGEILEFCEKIIGAADTVIRGNEKSLDNIVVFAEKNHGG